jgi:branched-chain amino acid transport system permease protein
MQFQILIQQIVNGLSLGSVYALIAVGYSLVYSILLFSNFSHGGFLVIGGYLCYYMLALENTGLWLSFINSDSMLARAFSKIWSPGLLSNIWTASAVSLIGAGIAAVIVEKMAYKPIRERTSTTLYVMIASMGMSIVIENLFVVTIGGRYKAIPPVIPMQTVELFAGATTSAFDLLSLATSVVFLIALQSFLVKTKWGLAIRAASCNLKVTGMMGVNVNRLIAIVFFVAGMLAAVGGIFLSARYTLYPQLGGNITTKAFVAAVIGGLGSLPGAVAGSIILGLAEMLTTGFLSSQYRDLIVFMLLIITLIIRPGGLLGKSIVEKV